MAFINNDYTARTELMGVLGLLGEYRQLNVKQVEGIYDNLNEEEARVVLHRAKNNGYAKEIEKDKFIVNSVRGYSYSNQMEAAINLGITLCKGNENADFFDFIACDDPFLMYAQLGNEGFDIIYIEQGKEKIIANKLKRICNEDSKVLAIIEHEGQAEFLNIDCIAAKYLCEDGNLRYVE